MGDNWKWWHFVVVGTLVGAYGGFEIYSGRIGKAVGSLILAAACVVVGLVSRATSDSQAG